MPNKQPHREPENVGRKSPQTERHSHDEEGKNKVKNPQKNQDQDNDRDEKSRQGFGSPSRR
jgi:hypothetical protein